jgi:hypothetical protein
MSFSFIDFSDARGIDQRSKARIVIGSANGCLAEKLKSAVRRAALAVTRCTVTALLAFDRLR